MEILLTIFIIAVITIIVAILIMCIIAAWCYCPKKEEIPMKDRTVKAIKFLKAQKHPGKDLLIPRIIMQTNETDRVPPGMFKAMKTIIDLNPEYEYRYYSDESAQEYLRSHYGHRVVNAYNDLIPGAYKADFFRYCFLYMNGGVYLDCGMVCIVPLRKIVKPNDTFISAEDNGSNFVYNAFMCSTKGNCIVGKAIELCLLNIESRDLTDDMLNITGPGLLGKAFRHIVKEIPNCDVDYDAGIKLLRHRSAGVLKADPKNYSGEIDHKELVCLKTKYPEYAEERQWYNTKKHYGELWWNKDIYYSKRQITEVDLRCPPKAAPPENERILVRVPDDRSGKYKKKHQKIPRIIIQTNESSEVPKKMFESMKSVRDMNPDYDYRYYNQERRRKYIVRHFGHDLLDVYDCMIPGAFRADLFRYCFLYHTGGVYVDSGMVCKSRFKKVFRHDDVFVLPEDDGAGRPCNGFMACAPEHPIILAMIEKIIKNVKRRDYCESSLHITGPALFKGVFLDYIGDEAKPDCDYGKGIRLIRHRSARTISGDPCVSPGEIDSDGTLILMTKYPLYHLDMIWYHDQPHYDTMWNIRQVYR